MVRRKMVRCRDINTPYCPCLLAATNHCIFCGHLQNRGICDCDWSGVCVYYEYLYNNKKEPVKREQILAPIVSIQSLGEQIQQLRLAVPPEMAYELKSLGAFVFLRAEADQDSCYLPIGVMEAGEDYIDVVIEAVGPKSARVLSPNQAALQLKGPYFNGVLGQPWIEELKYGTILLIAGGMGLPPAWPIARKLVEQNNQVIWLAAPGRFREVFLAEKARNLGIVVQEVPSLRRDGMKWLEEYLVTESLPDLVVSSGPDEQHHGIINLMHQLELNLPLAVTNNAVMCCGEGLCGSCIKVSEDGQVHRLCKIQKDYRSLL